MSCGEARELFSASVDGLLTPAQRARLDRHVEACPDCSREWERFCRTVDVLRSVGEARAPAGFAARVIEAASRGPWHRRLLRRLFLPLHVKLPLEALGLAVVAALVIQVYRETPEFQRAGEAPPPVTTAPAPLRQMAESQRAAAPEPARDKDQAKKPEVAAEREGVRDAPKPSRAPAQPSIGSVEAPSGKPGSAVETKEGAQAKLKSAPAEQANEPPRGAATRESSGSLQTGQEPRFAARGPFHVIGALRPKDRGALEAQLAELLKQVGGSFVAPAARLDAEGIVEVAVPGSTYQRFVEGLGEIGEFTVESQAQEFPDRVRISLRIVY